MCERRQETKTWHIDGYITMHMRSQETAPECGNLRRCMRERLQPAARSMIPPYATTRKSEPNVLVELGSRETKEG